jgi:tRNA pseudouridine38-40 synthase
MKPTTEEQRNIKLVLAYDGTDFCGWQRQKNARSVQAEIEAALEKIHKAPVHLTGSGRTDSGVHAAGQAANFYTSLAMEAGRFRPALNSLLSREIRILSSEEVPLDFHARFDAVLRTYRYFMIAGREALPHELRFAWRLRRSPGLARLNRLAGLLRGEMDCSLFASPQDPSLSRFRFIQGASFFVERDRLVFEISANAFLWKMVRSCLGTLLMLEEAGLDAQDFAALLESGDRRLGGPTVPPEGLFLWHIHFAAARPEHASPHINDKR